MSIIAVHATSYCKFRYTGTVCIITLSGFPLAYPKLQNNDYNIIVKASVQPCPSLKLLAPISEHNSKSKIPNFACENTLNCQYRLWLLSVITYQLFTGSVYHMNFNVILILHDYQFSIHRTWRICNFRK